VSRHVTYHEHILPYTNHNQPFQWQYYSNNPISSAIEPEPIEPINNTNLNRQQSDTTNDINPDIYEPEVTPNIEVDNHDPPPTHTPTNPDSTSL
jgi:hypothetical protein